MVLVFNTCDPGSCPTAPTSRRLSLREARSPLTELHGRDEAKAGIGGASHDPSRPELELVSVGFSFMEIKRIWCKLEALRPFDPL